jgi:hypothetical protein
MPVLEMMEKNLPVVGLTVSHDIGFSKPIVGEIVSTKTTKTERIIDGELSVWYSYGISFGGCSYYTVGNFTKVLDNL